MLAVCSIQAQLYLNFFKKIKILQLRLCSWRYVAKSFLPIYNFFSSWDFDRKYEVLCNAKKIKILESTVAALQLAAWSLHLPEIKKDIVDTTNRRRYKLPLVPIIQKLLHRAPVYFSLSNVVKVECASKINHLRIIFGQKFLFIASLS